MRGLETKGRDGCLEGLWVVCEKAEEEGRRKGSLSLAVAFIVDL